MTRVIDTKEATTKTAIAVLLFFISSNSFNPFVRPVKSKKVKRLIMSAKTKPTNK
jgi:hypothetical protein